MKEKLIELMKEKHFYNASEGIIELEECDVEIMAEAIIKLYNLHFVMQRSELLKFAEWEKGKNYTEEYEWNGAAGILKIYLEEVGKTTH